MYRSFCATTWPVLARTHSLWHLVLISCQRRLLLVVTPFGSCRLSPAAHSFNISHSFFNTHSSLCSSTCHLASAHAYAFSAYLLRATHPHRHCRHPALPTAPSSLSSASLRQPFLPSLITELTTIWGSQFTGTSAQCLLWFRLVLPDPLPLTGPAICACAHCTTRASKWPPVP